MKGLVACEYSQVVTKAFRDRGHEFYSCDILPTEGNPEWHIQDDVLKHLDDGWDIMIAHDPCTYQCNSGVRWLYERNGRWELLRQSCEFTKRILNAPIPKIARENPIPHKYALELIGIKYNQIIQPWMFGHGETKATCLWLKNLPPLIATSIHPDREQRIFKMTKSDKRGHERSRTFQGIANAMAEQWG